LRASLILEWAGDRPPVATGGQEGLERTAAGTLSTALLLLVVVLFLFPVVSQRYD
jgi:hypothetical protein